MTLETGGASSFLPQRPSLASLRTAVQRCRGCPLYRNAKQAVFGRGPARATLMLVGEQPGNDEDLKGVPFVGPAGRILGEALAQAGLDRKAAYVTNVVKHFKWEARGPRRMHKKPNAREIDACEPWLGAELELVRPAVLVCLGATAAQALLGRSFRLTAHHGEDLSTALAAHTLATIHPSAVLRQRSAEERERAMAQLVADLRIAATLLPGPKAVRSRLASPTRSRHPSSH